MKKILSIVAVFAFFVLTAGSVGASWSVNDGSTLDWIRSRFTSLNVSNSNNADISNYVSATSSTGGNVIAASEDVENGEIRSGDAEASTEVENVANDIDSDIEVNTHNTDANALGSINFDDDSDVNITDESEEELNLENENDVNARNYANAAALTGHNVVTSKHDDVEGGSIESGSATTSSSVANAFNILRSRIMWGN